MLAAEPPESERAQGRLSVAIGEPFADRSQLTCCRVPDRAPRHAAGDLEGRHRKHASVEPLHVAHDGHRLSVPAFDDPPHLAQCARRAVAFDLVAPQRLVSGHGEEIPASSARVEPRRKRGVAGDEGAHPEFRIRLGGSGGPRVHEDDRAAASLDRHLVAELPVEPRNAGDELHQMTALGAPRVQRVEQRAHQAASAILGAGADQLRLSGGHPHAAERERLRHEHARRDDPPARVLDDQRIFRDEPRMPAGHQIFGPSRQAVVRFRRILRPEDVRVEQGERARVGRASASKAEPVTEIARKRHGGPGNYAIIRRRRPVIPTAARRVR